MDTLMTIPTMVEDLRTLVECESPSDDVRATARWAEVVAELGRRRMGRAPEVISTGA